MSKHTPGPWSVAPPTCEYEARNFDRSIMTHTKSGNPVSVARAYNNIGTEVDANARLIAAAPDMADALDEARKFADWCLKNAVTLHHTDIQMYALALSDTVAAALNKALGES